METPHDQTLDFEITESLHDTLAKCERPQDLWLWCLYCERFFQARHLRIDYLGNCEGCAFCTCAGFDCAIFKWDTFREPHDSNWPVSESVLSHGLRIVNPPAQ